jgi:ribosome-associated translation inhibitor RaiA
MSATFNQNEDLDVEFRLDNCTITPERKAYLASELKLIPQLVQDLPFRKLHIDIHKHPHKSDFHLKMCLKEGDTQIFTGGRHHELMPAFHSCVNKMVAKLQNHKKFRIGKHQWQREPEIEC